MGERRAGIVLVTRNFPPLRGGMERLNQRMLAGLASAEPAGLVGPSGSAAFAPPGVPVREAPASPISFLPRALAATIGMVRRRRPRIVLAGSGLTAPLALFAARLAGARCAAYVHGLDIIVPNRIYQRFWLPCIRRCDVVIANSRNTARLAAERGVDPGRLHVVHPGTDLPEAGGEDMAQWFRAAHAMGSRPLLLSVGRLTPRKGLVEFVRDVLPLVLRDEPDALFVVIGADATDALARGGGAGSERARILEAVRQLGLEASVTLLPPCDDASLSAAYRAANVHVFPVREIAGDVEGFGMVAVEAAAHGLPTVAYAVGGVPDAVSGGVSGALVEPGDSAAFADATRRWLHVDSDARAACRAFAERFAWPRFDTEIRRVLAAGDEGPWHAC